MSDRQPSVSRRFVRVSAGEVHIACAGEGPPVLLLHQTPRSWDEYRDVLPLLAAGGWTAIAMDTIGFGDSSVPPWRGSIERYGAVAVEVLDALGIDRVALVGHHTGAVIAIELAARYPDRVARLVASSAPFVDAAFRRKRSTQPALDAVELTHDGSHLTEQWRRRSGFYPAGRPDLLHRYVIDVLKAGPRAEEGHEAVSAYEMERAIDRVRAATLLIAAPEDPYAYPHAARLAARLPGCTVVEIPGGMVPLPEQLPEAFAAAVADFLEGYDW